MLDSHECSRPAQSKDAYLPTAHPCSSLAGLNVDTNLTAKLPPPFSPESFKLLEGLVSLGQITNGFVSVSWISEFCQVKEMELDFHIDPN